MTDLLISQIFPAPRYEKLHSEDGVVLTKYLVEKLNLQQNNTLDYYEHYKMLIHCLYSFGADTDVLSEASIIYVQKLFDDPCLVKYYNEDKVVLAEGILLVFAMNLFAAIGSIQPKLELLLSRQGQYNAGDTLDEEYNFILRFSLLILKNKDKASLINDYKSSSLAKVDYNSILTPVLESDLTHFLQRIDENIESAVSRANASHSRSKHNNILQKTMGYYDYGQILNVIGYLKLAQKINPIFEKSTAKYKIYL